MTSGSTMFLFGHWVNNSTQIHVKTWRGHIKKGGYLNTLVVHPELLHLLFSIHIDSTSGVWRL